MRGRPRIYQNNAEKMRAYRARLKEQKERLQRLAEAKNRPLNYNATVTKSQRKI